MIQIPIRIVPATQAQRETTAWFVPGVDVPTWFAELSLWNIPLEALVLLPVPRSFETSIPAGVLVVDSGRESDDRRAHHKRDRGCRSARVIAYGSVTRRLFVPVDARLVPAIGDAELEALLPDDHCDYVWHPSSGFLRFDPADRLTVADLLQAPPERSANWDRAIPGLVFRSRIVTLEPDEQLTAEDVLQQAASDIGSQSSKPGDLPPAPDEWLGGTLNQISKPVRHGIRSLLDWLGRQRAGKIPPSVGNTPSKLPGWVQLGLAPFSFAAGATALAASKLLQRIGSLPFIDQLTRSREIDRLMHLLKQDPDQGLRFALPLNRTDLSRGIAAPTNRLFSRNISFDLGRLGGGGPADFWDIPADQQVDLMRQYRELALREIRLGRHRRAAYIYSELLNDMVSAAGALEAGSHFREAAVLFRERLKRPSDAARCLEHGGLLDEAAELYVELGQFELAADLYLRLDRRDEADRLLNSWVDQLVESGDLRNASRVLCDKLQDPDRAIRVLESGWPRSNGAQWCLQELFLLWGKHQRHDDARNRILGLRSETAGSNVTKMLTATLVKVSVEYPDAAVRDLAADSTLILVGRTLREASSSDTIEMLAHVRRLAPGDRLLSRDCDRFQRAKESRSASKTLAKRTENGIVPLHSFSLSSNDVGNGLQDSTGTASFVRGFGEAVKWSVAKAAGPTAYISGFGHNSLVLQRICWANPNQKNMRTFWAGISDVRNILLEPFPGDEGNPILHVRGHEPIGKRSLPACHSGTRPAMLVGSPAWATSGMLALARSADGCGWRLRNDFGTLALMSFSRSGEPLHCRDVPPPTQLEGFDADSITMFISAQRVRIGIENALLSQQIGGHDPASDVAALWDYFPEEIRHLTGLYLGEKFNWLMALFDTGGMLIDEVRNDVKIPIAEDLESPRATFLGDGRFIVAGLGSVLAYSIVNARPRLIGKSELAGTPISVTTTHRMGEFAVFSDDGNVQVFELR